MKKYIPYAVIALIIFFAGRFSKPDHSSELEQKWKAERELLMESVVQKQIQVTDLIAAQKEVEEKRKADSLYFAGELSENQRAYTALKKKYNEINLSRATHSELDSLIGVLFPD